MAGKTIDLKVLTRAERAHVVRRCFREALATPEGLIVREELARVGRLHKTTFVLDDTGGRRSANLEGRKWMTMFVEAMSAPDDDALTALLEAEEKKRA